jgi:deoxycytidylate deaminase
MWYKPYASITTDMKWKPLLKEVYQFASENSNDISTFTAASLVNDQLEKLVIASNGFPSGTKTIPGWDQKPLKDAISNHAERAVVYKAAKEGIPTNGLTMVMAWVPCFPCANSIIYSGVKTLVCHKQMVERTPADWVPELTQCLKLLKANHIKILMYDGKIGGVKGFMRKENWDP